MRKVVMYTLTDPSEIKDINQFLKDKAFSYFQCVAGDEGHFNTLEDAANCIKHLQELPTYYTRITPLVEDAENEVFGIIGITSMEELLEEYLEWKGLKEGTESKG